MKKTTSRILLSALTVLALLSLSGCAQEKEENTKQSDPQARDPAMLRDDLRQHGGNRHLSHPRDG